MKDAVETITDEIPGALAIEPHYVVGLPNRGHTLNQSDVGIRHPTLGWGRVDIVNAEQFRCRFANALVWFSLSSAEVAQWPIENAAAFTGWVRRVGCADAWNARHGGEP